MLLLETNGDYQLMDASTGALVRHEGYSCVPASGFIDTRMAVGQIKLVARLIDSATDEEYLETLKSVDGDHELAKASFLDRFDESKPAETAKKDPPKDPPKTPAVPPAK